MRVLFVHAALSLALHLPIVAVTDAGESKEAGPVRYDVEENGQATLECVRPSDSARAGWSRSDNQPLPEQHYFERHLLIIPRIKKKDGGTYYCIALYANGNTRTTSAVVNVIGEPNSSTIPEYTTPNSLLLPHCFALPLRFAWLS